MTDHAVSTTMHRSPFTLPFSVATALELVQRLRDRAARARVPASTRFPATDGATDLDIARFARRGDLSETIRRKRVELWKRGGAGLHHI